MYMENCMLGSKQESIKRSVPQMSMENCMLSNHPISAGEQVYAFLLLSHPYLKPTSLPTDRYEPIIAVKGTYDGFGGLENIESHDTIQNFLRFYFKDNTVKAENFTIRYDTISLEEIMNRKRVFRMWPIRRDGAIETMLSTIFIRADVLDPLLSAFKNEPEFRQENDSLDKLIELFISERHLLPSSPITETLEQIRKQGFFIEKIEAELDKANLQVFYGDYSEAYLELLKEDAPLFRKELLLLFSATQILGCLNIAWHIPCSCISEKKNEIQKIFFSTCKELQNKH